MITVQVTVLPAFLYNSKHLLKTYFTYLLPDTGKRQAAQLWGKTVHRKPL